MLYEVITVRHDGGEEHADGAEGEAAEQVFDEPAQRHADFPKSHERPLLDP